MKARPEVKKKGQKKSERVLEEEKRTRKSEGKWLQMYILEDEKPFSTTGRAL